MVQMIKLDKYLINSNALMRKAIIKINKLGGSCLIVVNSQKKLEGVLSSYDLRKAIMDGNVLNKTINKIYNKNPKFIFSEKLHENLAKTYSTVKRLHLIPVIDKNSKKVVDILNQENIEKLNKKELKKLQATIIIMAGGKGVRLRPYTSVLPKPLMPINDKPVIQHIIEQFNKHGDNDFIITLNYKSDILKSFFENLNTKKNKINFIYEKKPLGTAGSLFRIKRKVKENFILTNCDTIIKHNYSNILKSHVQNKNDITIVVSEKRFVLPYGICDYTKTKFLYKEKPSLKYKVNTGFYIISKNCLNLLKKEKYLDFNEFLEICIKNKKKINCYKVKPNSWTDVGQMNTYKENLNKKI